MSKRIRANQNEAPSEASAPASDPSVVAVEVPAEPTISEPAASPDAPASESAESAPAITEPELPRTAESFVERLDQIARRPDKYIARDHVAEIAAALLRHESLAPEDVEGAAVRATEIGIMTTNGQRIVLPRAQES